MRRSVRGVWVMWRTRCRVGRPSLVNSLIRWSRNTHEQVVDYAWGAGKHSVWEQSWYPYTRDKSFDGIIGTISIMYALCCSTVCQQAWEGRVVFLQPCDFMTAGQLCNVASLAYRRSFLFFPSMKCRPLRRILCWWMWFCRRIQCSLGNVTWSPAPNRLCESVIKGEHQTLMESQSVYTSSFWLLLQSP